jgi:hypothetical protein
LNAFWFFSAGHFQKRLGTLHDDDFFEMEAIMGFWTSRPGVKDWWKRYGRARYNPQFVAYLEEEFLRHDA